MVDETMTSTCPECFENDETEYVVSQDTDGAVGVYCWRCEVLTINDALVVGDTRIINNDL